MRWTVAALGALLVMGCGSEPEREPRPNEEQHLPEPSIASAGSSSSEQSSTTPHVRIVSPKTGDTLTGSAELTLELLLPEAYTSVELGINDEWSRLKAPSTSLSLATSGAPNGTTTLGYRVTAADGTVYEDSVEVLFDNPEHRLESYTLENSTYSNGDEISIELAYSEGGLSLAIDASDLDTEFSASAVAIQDLGKGAYRATVPISENNQQEDGLRVITVSATNSAGEVVHNNLQVELRKLPPIEFNVTGGAFSDRGKPPVALISEGAPRILSVTSEPTLVTGGTLNLALEWEESADNPAARIIIASEDHSGYWVVPVDEADGEQTVELTLPRLKAEAGIRPSVTVVDGTGRAIEWVTHPINQLIVGSGGVQVSLTWDAPVDLDLHVTDPTGTLVDWGAMGMGDGKLDLDSNAECELDNINTENIFWADGKEVPGPYAVNVSYYAACGFEQDVRYKVAVQSCGRVTTHEGVFSASDAKEDPYDLGRLVTQVVMDCTQKVSGKVSFEKQELASSPGSPGTFTATAKFTPARFIPVQAIRTSDDKCLARTVTDANGAYTLRFNNDGDPKFKVTAEPRWGNLRPATSGNGCPDFDALASVQKLTGSAVYSAETAEQDGSKDSNISGLDLKVAMSQDSGAFNINDVVAQGYNWVLTRWGKELPKLAVRWEAGKNTPVGTSYYDGGSTFFILGKTDDPDEWDDTVIAHELSHFIVEKLSKSDTPGGNHALYSHSVPPLAWNEGLATALAVDELGRKEYFDSSVDASGVIAASVFTPEAHPQILPGTHNGAMSGNIDETLIASIVYDLLDDKNEPHDKLDVNYHNVLGSLFTYLPRRGRTNRGAAGVDLVDFLDGWRCQDQILASVGGGNGDANLRTLLNDPTVNFPYDFPTLTCP